MGKPCKHVGKLKKNSKREREPNTTGEQKKKRETEKKNESERQSIEDSESFMLVSTIVPCFSVMFR